MYLDENRSSSEHRNRTANDELKIGFVPAWWWSTPPPVAGFFFIIIIDEDSSSRDNNFDNGIERSIDRILHLLLVIGTLVSGQAFMLMLFKWASHSISRKFSYRICLVLRNSCQFSPDLSCTSITTRSEGKGRALELGLGTPAIEYDILVEKINRWIYVSLIGANRSCGTNFLSMN